MTNATLDNSAGNSEVILWQYDQAPNLVSLISRWNDLAKASTEDFWNDKFLRDVLNVDTATEFGLTVWGRILGIPWPTVRMSSTGTNPVKISADLYRRLLKFRFFQMVKPPTIANYNRGLEIMFPTSTQLDDNYQVDGEVTRYYARNRVLDFSNATNTTGNTTSNTLRMSMGFTFPTDATDEEAYLLFQHYDQVYAFPAGICTNNSFFRTDLAIGFDGQDQRNFADAFAWADDDTVNGGIFSGNMFSGYRQMPGVHGTAFVIDVTSGKKKARINTGNYTGEVWIDWGDGDFGYYHDGLKDTSGNTYYENDYAMFGRYAVCVYYTGSVTVTYTIESARPTYVTTYNIG